MAATERILASAGVASRPLIAVVVPTYRRPEQAMRMFDALEKQTLSLDQFEVVIVDDCSGRDVLQRLERRAAASPLAVSVLSTDQNSGPATARNAGWRATRAPLLAFTDDDCVPEPDWLAAGLLALADDDRIGVLQGRTRSQDAAAPGDWAVRRQVLWPTPFFEACNIFYRREALEQTGGFDENIRWYGEDAAAGWAVLDAGWERDFAKRAVVVHDVEERGVSWHVRNGYLERNLVTLAARHPRFRREAFWRPWAFRRENAVFTLAAAGVMLAVTARWRPALILAMPYLLYRWPPRRHPRRAWWLAERMAVDAAQAVGLLVGSARNRIVVL